MGRGVGPPEKMPRCAIYLFSTELGFWKIRQFDLAPLHWHASDGAAAYKRPSAGPKCRRSARVLPALGKGFYAFK
eukprot:8409143-Pyramimonas_sp.AAC.1